MSPSSFLSALFFFCLCSLFANQSESNPCSMDMTENPRFAKPKLQSSPLSSPKPKWQPSPYLRLLESQMQPAHKQGNLETTHVQIQSFFHTTDDQSGFQAPEYQFTCQTTEHWSHHEPPTPQAGYSAPESRPSLQCLSVSATRLLTLKHVVYPKEQPPITSKSSEKPFSAPALGGMLQRLKLLEDKNAQKAVQAQSAREFSKKSIRERAEQLSVLFSGTPSQAVGTSPSPASSPLKALLCPSLPEPSALSCLLSPLPETQPKQCNGHSESDQTAHDDHGQKSCSEIKRVQCLDPSKQRTVGKVSSVIGVKAATLAILYETDHRPNNPYTLSLTDARRCQQSGSVSLRKEFAPGMGGSDTCHFCKKRVYVMERLSAEGYFFHRECFRCEVCSATLRLGGHVFDQGTFYCKLHFSQHKTSHRLRKPEVYGGVVSVLGDPDGDEFSARGSLHSQPSVHKDHIEKAPKDAENTAESSAETNPSGLPEFTSNSRDGGLAVLAAESEPLDKVEKSYSRGEITIRNHHWRRKIRATFPLILVKVFEQKEGGDDALLEEDADSDFEELHALEPENHTADSHCPLQQQPEKSAVAEIPRYRTHFISSTPKPNTCSPEQQSDASTIGPDQQNSFSPKKKLTLSMLEKERLLNWDLTTPGQFSSTLTATEQAEKYIRRPDNLTKPQTNPEPQPEPSPIPAEPESSPPLSGFQLWASVLRNSVIKRNHPPKTRPHSEGSFSFLFGSSTENQKEDVVTRSRAATEGIHGRTASRSEITTMLKQVALSNKPSEASKDDMASLPPRKLNFFSSMRLKRNEGGDRSKTENQTKDVWSILSKFKNKASSQRHQQQDEGDYSSSEEEQKFVSQRSESWHSDRRRKQQEKTLIMQAKREHLKRLHRAQVIQRQLEEVEEKQRSLEEKGVMLEKVLRGEREDASADEAELLHMWFKLVLEKNKLARYESELMIFAQELELEDTQSRLQQDLRRRMGIEDCKKSTAELEEEQRLLDQVMKVVEKRDQLVSLLEEQRLQEKAEDHDLESLILSKGYQFHWA